MLLDATAPSLEACEKKKKTNLSSRTRTRTALLSTATRPPSRSPVWVLRSRMLAGGGHSSRRRMNADDEYVTEEPAANVRYVCSKMSDNAPEQFIPGMAKTRLEQVETCANVETCTKECDFKLDGE